ncbi:hypothetical protein FPV67DRAFT_1532175 [Lyophyllum atratum]|nr:hypothetical protein FPV67DRAFT_1532175 [Lyophyllum atratum]
MNKNLKTDIVLPTTNDHLQEIVLGHQNHEFRKTRLPPSVQRIWFYTPLPHSHITYICEIGPATTRNPGDPPLLHDGLGNQQFNERHRDWAACDFAYFVRSVYRIHEPVTLQELKIRYGMKGAPRGLVYVPEGMVRGVPWDAQQRVLLRDVVDPRMYTPPTLQHPRALSPAPMDVDMDQPPEKISRGHKRCFSGEDFEIESRTKRQRTEGADVMLVRCAELMHA